VIVDSRVREGLDLELIGGLPAVAYDWSAEDLSANGLRYAVALDAEGTAWGVPETVDGNLSSPSFGSNIQVSLADIGGKPAIGYYDPLNADLKYAAKY
jgi:hypothetical protein